MNSTAQQITDRLRHRQGGGEGTITVDSDGASISVDIEHSDRYASGVRGITVQPHQPTQGVRDVAERIVEGVQDLGEPLAIVEYEERERRAVVRSSTPEQDAEGVTYWEADVQPEQTSLHRYRKDHDAVDRQVVTEPLLHPTAGRVAEQLADAVAPLLAA